MAQQSLYRRYRPRRFEELRGQDHVVRALRNAVAGNRVGQAYLFSGPRGTGKTSSARILAKVLNCENPQDGEPCGQCASCLAVDAGMSFDVIELDAASNNKVEDVRELIERVNLGSPGRHKVYILDEVHMLTPSAEAALLKTLEEPPPHVVFVLATTDPQKVRDTIRSRTQHLQFHLLPSEELAKHVRWVAADAGLDVDDAAIEAVVRQGAGSARDALTALEVVAASGGVAPDAAPLDEFIEALIEADPGRALAAVAVTIQQGRDARTIAETVLADLRECFLSLMAPELVQLPDARAAVVADQGRRLGAAAVVRAMEGIGDALVEMRHAPDPRVLLEVAFIKLTHVAAADDVASLAARLERLEHAVAAAASGASASPAPVDPVSGRAVLGGRARPHSVASSPQPAPSVAEPPPAAPAPASRSRSEGLATVFEQRVKPGLKGMAKAVYVAAQPVGEDGDVLRLRFPNEGHARRAREHRDAVEQSLSSEVGHRVTVAIEAAADQADADTPPRGESRPTPVPELDDEVDISELTDASATSNLSGIERIAAAFPGSELFEEHS
jgi:DNA polymerase-3 subunit gamma/tau